VPATTPSTSAAGRHPGLITNSKDPDIAYLEARRRPARVEERIKEAKECGLTNFPDSSFQANRGPLLPAEMAQVLLAWARRRWRSGELLAAAPERSRYQLRHGAGRLVRSGRLTTLGLDAGRPSAPELAAACGHRRSLPLTSSSPPPPTSARAESRFLLPACPPLLEPRLPGFCGRGPPAGAGAGYPRPESPTLRAAPGGP
jgi:hypothetical protein